MKKIIGVLLLLVVTLTCRKVSALEYTYSDWSTFYPSGLDPIFVESEVRYKWYTFENNRIIYTDKYYTEYEGYTKDEASETTFYRYITNPVVLMDSSNNLISDETYCNKNFCYSIRSKEPEMVDMKAKAENKYEDAEIFESVSEVVPMTGDNIIYSVFFGIISLIVISYLVVKKYKKVSNE